MKVSVNNLEIELHEGAKVKDAVRKYRSLTAKEQNENFETIHDALGNRVGADGGLVEGSSLFTEKKKDKSFTVGLLSCLFLLVPFFFSYCCVKKETKEIVILSVNDMHASLDDFPRFAFVVDSLRALYPDLLLLSGGDNQTGNPANDQYPEKGFPMIDLMNSLSFDISVVGNHEFDTGPEGFANLTRKANFPFVCANVFSPDFLDIKIKPYHIFTLPNGLKVGVLGLLQLGAAGIPDTHPEDVADFRFKSFDEVLPEYLWLKDSCDLFVALTHLGLPDDMLLAEQCPELGLIVGGHSHTLIEKELLHNGVLITQAGWRLRYANLTKIKLRDGKIISREWELINLREGTNENIEVRTMVDKYNDNPELKRVIAFVTDDFSTREELGYLMADAHRAGAEVDIAFQNRGGVRLDFFPKGPIRLMDVYRLDPFGNDMIIVKLKGEELLALATEACTVDDKRPLLASGLRGIYTFDEEGRIKDVVLKNEDGTPFDLSKTYTVSLSSYLNAIYKYSHEDLGRSFGRQTSDVLRSYLEKTKEIRSYRGEERNEINR